MWILSSRFVYKLKWIKKSTHNTQPWPATNLFFSWPPKMNFQTFLFPFPCLGALLKHRHWLFYAKVKNFFFSFFLRLVDKTWSLQSLWCSNGLTFPVVWWTMKCTDVIGNLMWLKCVRRNKWHIDNGAVCCGFCWQRELLSQSETWRLSVRFPGCCSPNVMHLNQKNL